MNQAEGAETGSLATILTGERKLICSPVGRRREICQKTNEARF